MRVFKFGGASVKDAEGVQNLLHILQLNEVYEKVVVISAMDKTTNALEEVVQAYVEQQSVLSAKIERIRRFHLKIAHDLFPENHPILTKINALIDELSGFLNDTESDYYDYIYDQVVPYGELLSTQIVSAFLNDQHVENTWLDVREIIQTNSVFRDAKVNWTVTQKQIQEKINRETLTITQGFIAADASGNTTTLGREGSDYTAGIIAFCLDAAEVCIWKNVPGVLNADPREFEETTLLEQISYQEAIELAFYGASVIHPKTLQPLQRKKIPLYVKSFYQPLEKGTSVCKGQAITPKIPCFIVKKELILVSISTSDFSFFVEENISEVFALFHQYQVKVHLIQNSAISFSVCIDNKFRKAEALIQKLQEKFVVSYNKEISLYTIRHFDQEAIEKIRKDRKVLLEQRTRGTVQFVVK